MSFKRCSSVLSLLLLLPAFASADWRIQQLTDDSYAESMPSVYLDSFDVPHFAWCSNTMATTISTTWKNLLAFLSR